MSQDPTSIVVELLEATAASTEPQAFWIRSWEACVVD